MSFGVKLKNLIQRCAGVFGYQIQKLREKVTAPIDILDLLLTKVSADRPDFFFVQIGANDGLTDDPVRQFVTRYTGKDSWLSRSHRYFSVCSKIMSRRSN